MSPIVLIVMGVMNACVIAAIVWFVAGFIAPPHKARRAALAALLGGTVGFSTTALVQGPFYDDAQTPMGLTPLVLAALAALGLGLLVAWMILKTKLPDEPGV